MTSVTGRRRWSRQAIRENLEGYAFISPWIAGFLLWTLGPFVVSLFLSFTRYTIIAPPEWVGLQQYRELFTDDPNFWQSLQVTFTYALFAVPLHLVLALIIALMLNQKAPLLGLWRTVYYLPAVISGVAVSTMWIWVFNPRFGLINTVLGFVGIQGPNWLGDPQWVLPSLILMSCWSAGGGMVILLGGLQGIPVELYEAAMIDGANAWRKFWHITIPMISPLIFFNLIMGVIGSFQYFTQAFIMTQGGPGRASLFYNLYLYQNAFTYFKMGYASAMAWVMFVVILVLTLLVIRSSPIWVYYEGTVKGGK